MTKEGQIKDKEQEKDHEEDQEEDQGGDQRGDQEGDKEEQTQEAAKETEPSRGKYVFECQRCGQCCEKKELIVVSMEDLRRWNEDVTLPSLYQFLSIEIKDNDYVQISLKKPEIKEGNPNLGCPMYDSENKICNIYFSMPYYCKSFPLGYDGDKYFLKDSSCLGIGKGNMNEKTLKEARKAAKSDFEERVTTALLLPVINGLALKFLMDESRKQMENLTKEQKDKLNDILGKDIKGD